MPNLLPAVDRTNRFPAKAGTHFSTSAGAEKWIPAFAGKRLMGSRESYSASGCFDGCASAKAGSAMQLS